MLPQHSTYLATSRLGINIIHVIKQVIYQVLNRLLLRKQNIMPTITEYIFVFKLINAVTESTCFYSYSTPEEKARKESVFNTISHRYCNKTETYITARYIYRYV